MKKKFGYRVAVVVAVFGAIVLYANAVILWRPGRIEERVERVPHARIALVFGGGMKSTTTMSELQEDRVIRAIELYKAGVVDILVMTGDDGARIIDEVHPMRDYAIAHGVAAEDVAIDPHGYRTYESCYRAGRVYGMNDIIAISQRFHLSRILYMCNTLGVQTIGVAADLRPYAAFWKMQLREVGARVKGWWQIEVSHPLPRSLEP
jgi:SanA protein